MSLRRSAMIHALLLITLLLAALPLAAQDGAFPQNTIQVNGSGTAFGAPDIAYIEIGYEIADEDLNRAFEQTSTTLYAIRDAVLALDIASEDIQTSGLSLWVDERYTDYGEEPQRFYRLSNAFRLIIRDIERVADVIDASVQAGANNIYGLQYGIADTDALEEQARARAAADAKARAANLAALFGNTVGEPLHISEFSGARNSSVRLEALAMADAGIGSGGGGPIEAGQLSVRVDLSVTFHLLPAEESE